MSNLNINKILSLLDCSKYIHVSIDLETLATDPNASVWQFGIMTSEGTSFYTTCHPFRCMGNQDPDTVTWQYEHNSENFNFALEQEMEEHVLAIELFKALQVIHWSAESSGKKILWWAKSKEFDFPIMKNLLSRHGFGKEAYESVVKFYDTHEYRTIQLLTGMYDKPGEGAHNALVDARFQLDHLFLMLGDLGSYGNTMVREVPGPAGEDKHEQST